MYTNGKGGNGTAKFDRKVLEDLSDFAEEALINEPMVPIIELHLPKPVAISALHIVIGWMRKVYGRYPTRPLTISDIEKMCTDDNPLDYNKVLAVFDIVHHVLQLKPRAASKQLYPWVANYINDNVLTVEQVGETWEQFSDRTGFLKSMCYWLYKRGVDVCYTEEEQQRLEALKVQKPELGAMMEEYEQKHENWLKAQECKKERAEQKAEWAEARKYREVRAAKKHQHTQTQAQKKALAKDGQRLISDEEANRVMGGVVTVLLPKGWNKPDGEAAEGEKGAERE